MFNGVKGDSYILALEWRLPPQQFASISHHIFGLVQWNPGFRLATRQIDRDVQPATCLCNFQPLGLACVNLELISTLQHAVFSRRKLSSSLLFQAQQSMLRTAPTRSRCKSLERLRIVQIAALSRPILERSPGPTDLFGQLKELRSII